MAGIDVVKAAIQEADTRYGKPMPFDANESDFEREAFIAGAEWAQEQYAPMLDRLEQAEADVLNVKRLAGRASARIELVARAERAEAERDVLLEAMEYRAEIIEGYDNHQEAVREQLFEKGAEIVAAFGLTEP